MTARDRDPITAVRVVKYMVGGTILFFGFAALVSLPIATIVGLWVLGNAALTFFGAI